MSELFVPVVEADSDPLTAALAYAPTGWYVGPVRRGSKSPGSVLGDHWHTKTSRDPKVITAWFAGTDHGVFLHCGRSGAVVLDVDHPDQLPEVLAAAIAVTRPPFQSTRTTDLRRGHYVFAVPEGDRLGNGTGRLGKAWGEIRGHNGVIVVAPSEHVRADQGGCYVWLKTGEVPVLPASVAVLLPEQQEASDAATDAEVAVFLKAHTTATRPKLLRAVEAKFTSKIEAGESRHEAAVEVVCWAMREAQSGLYPARLAAQRLRQLFVEAITMPRRLDDRVLTKAEARSEFGGIVAWAVAQAAATDDLDKTEWPELIPLDPPRAPAPFPVDALPGWAARYVTALAEATQTPPDLAGCCVLGVFATCAGGRAVVEARRGWREPLNLYLLPVLRPGSRKSAVVSATTYPLCEVEKALATRVAATITETTSLRDIAQRGAEKARRDAVNAKGGNRDNLLSDAVSAAAAAEGIEVPVIPRLIADDVTPEAAASLLADHGGRMAIISAEGGIFEIIAGRYSNGVPALDVWLKGHAGDPLRVDRKGRPSEYVERPALTMLCTVQPSVLSDISRNGAFRGRGLLARVLYSIPRDNLGHRKIGPDPVPEHVTDTYTQHVRKLAEDLADWTDSAVLRLSDDAHELLLDTERLIEPQLAEDGNLARIAEWGSKLAGAILRIAGLLHLASESESFRTPISRATLHDAVRVGTYFIEHAQAAFNLLGHTGTSDAEYLLTHLTKTGTEEFTIRDLLTALPRGRFTKVDDVQDAVTVLEDHGYVLPKPPPEHKGPGRKPSPGYIVRPGIAAESAQSAQ